MIAFFSAVDNDNLLETFSVMRLLKRSLVLFEVSTSTIKNQPGTLDSPVD